LQDLCSLTHPTNVSNWTKIFTVIASEGKQSQSLRLPSFHMANATQRLRNDIV